MCSSSRSEGGFFMFQSLYEVVVNEWGETTYVPTTLGNILLVLVICLFLLGAMFFAKRNGKNKKMSVKQLAYCAASIALGTILSMVKMIDFPTGGSATLFSMLAICLPGYWFGLGAGIMTGVAHGILQLLLGPYVLYPTQLIVDYILAFGALGLSGLFAGHKWGLQKGYIAGVLGRYVFAVISGWVFFGAYAWEGWGAFSYSLVYNGIYIFTEMAITLVILFLPPVRKGLAYTKKLATE